MTDVGVSIAGSTLGRFASIKVITSFSILFIRLLSSLDSAFWYAIAISLLQLLFTVSKSFILNIASFKLK